MKRNSDARRVGVLLVLGGVLLLAPTGCQRQGEGPKASLPLESSAEASDKQAGSGSPTAGAAAAVPEAPAPGGTAAAAEGVPATSALTGTLEPHRRSTLAPRAAASVARVHVQEGDRVHLGDPLVSLDTSDIELQLAQAQAAVEAAQVQYDQAAIDLDRTVKLAESQQVSAANLDLAKTRVKAMKVGRAQAEIALSMAQKAVRDAVIRAPFNGVVTRKFVSEGERVASMPPTNLVTIEETELLDLRIQVPEMQMEQVKPGDPVVIHFAALSKDVTAQISRIIPSNDPRTRSFAAIVEIPNKDLTLRPGMFGEVRRGEPGGKQATR